MPKSGLIIYIDNHSCHIFEDVKKIRRTIHIFSDSLEWRFTKVFWWKFHHIKLKLRIVIFLCQYKVVSTPGASCLDKLLASCRLGSIHSTGHGKDFWIVSMFLNACLFPKLLFSIHAFLLKMGVNKYIYSMWRATPLL